jgi:hypothetical protein
LLATSIRECYDKHRLDTEELINTMSKLGPLFFFVLIIVVALGVVSFSSEFFLGRPFIEVVREFLFMAFRR